MCCVFFDNSLVVHNVDCLMLEQSSQSDELLDSFKASYKHTVCILINDA